jgi:hypothetical protein
MRKASRVATLALGALFLTSSLALAQTAPTPAPDGNPTTQAHPKTTRSKKTTRKKTVRKKTTRKKTTTPPPK